MADISMCKGTDNYLCETCFRKTASPSPFQSWLAEIPLKNNECELYWKDNRDDNR